MATDRLMATPWRFEANKGSGNMLKIAQQENITVRIICLFEMLRNFFLKISIT